MPRARFVFVNRFYLPDLSATSQYLGELTQAVAREGFEVHVLTSRLAYQGGGSTLAAEETIGAVHVHRVWTSSFGRHNLGGRGIDYLSFYLASFFFMLRFLRRGDVVVAKTDPPLISVVAMVAARLRGARLVNWLQDLFPEVAAAAGIRMARGPAGYLLRALRNWSLRHAQANVAIGGLMHARLLANGLAPGKLTVIPNWALGDVRPVDHEPNPLRAEWGLQDRFVVCYSGNLGRAHEFAAILEAAALLYEQKDIVFLFIGGGSNLRAARKLALHAGLRNVRFEPYQARAKLSYSLGVADVHLVSLSPKFEGLVVPSKFYGIAAAARPVIALGSADGEIGRLLEQCQGGKSVAPDDAAALAQQIKQWRDAPLDARATGQRLWQAHGQEGGVGHVVAVWRQLLDAAADKAVRRAVVVAPPNL